VSKSRARNLDDDAIARIVSILDGWKGRLTWETVIEAVDRHAHVRYTRQTLHKHERIRQAFAQRKKALQSGSSEREIVGPPELRAALEHIARLEAENARLEAENQNLLGQFARWAYNANTRGFDRDFMNRPLPAVNRDQTAIPPKSVKTSNR
jgi:uncharacterized protein (UPF0335 family)